MARIRTIKPEFFRHYELFEAEKETGLPLRLAFIGLWTVCDREGRFKWRPEMLKVECLPYDTIDFSKVLEALHEREFIEKYEYMERHYGWVPSFNSHQIINLREAKSAIPAPEEGTHVHARASTCNYSETHVQARGERKGKEGKGKEKEEEGNEDFEFDFFWDAYDKKVGDKDKIRRKWMDLKQEERDAIFKHLPLYKEAQPDKAYRKDPATYLNNKSWNDEVIKKQAPGAKLNVPTPIGKGQKLISEYQRSMEALAQELQHEQHTTN